MSDRSPATGCGRVRVEHRLPVLTVVAAMKPLSVEVIVFSLKMHLRTVFSLRNSNILVRRAVRVTLVDSDLVETRFFHRSFTEPTQWRLSAATMNVPLALFRRARENRGSANSADTVFCRKLSGTRSFRGVHLRNISSRKLIGRCDGVCRF